MNSKKTTKYTVAAAARVTGKSPTTIRKHITDGDLTAEVLSNGKKRIDASELYRAYGEDCNFDQEEGRTTPSSPGTGAETSHELKAVQDQLKQEQTERQREQRQHENQIEFLQGALGKSQEGHNRATLLLEHSSKGEKEWEPVFERLQTELTNIKNEHKNEIRKYRTALTKERQKPFWRKILGGGG